MAVAPWESLETGAGYRWRPPCDAGDSGDAASISHRGVLERWIEDPAFVDLFRDALRAADGPGKWPAFFWEMPAVCAATLERPFECVALPAPSLARMTPDPAAFREHFDPAHSTATFVNLSGDALLVAPNATSAPFPHLAAFVRDASADEWRALFCAVGSAALRRLDERPDPVWISTSGLGVAWLHIRLDDRPKYYQHAPYRRAR